MKDWMNAKKGIVVMNRKFVSILTLLFAVALCVSITSCDRNQKTLATVVSPTEEIPEPPAEEPEPPAEEPEPPAETIPEPPEGMALIPAGSFTRDTIDDVRTIHIEYAFYMDTHEVTNAEYQTFVLANPEWQEANISDALHRGNYLKDWDGNDYPWGKGDHPVTNVNWYGAMAYAAWAGKRLPTAVEWEHAARGGLVGKRYPWGNTITPDDANYGNNVGDTTPVGSYAANGYGLYDMAGNVAEWCLNKDPFDSNPNIAEIIENYRSFDSDLAVRGGDYWGSDREARIFRIDNSYPQTTIFGIGFRCARAITP